MWSAWWTAWRWARRWRLRATFRQAEQRYFRAGQGYSAVPMRAPQAQKRSPSFDCGLFFRVISVSSIGRRDLLVRGDPASGPAFIAPGVRASRSLLECCSRIVHPSACVVKRQSASASPPPQPVALTLLSSPKRGRQGERVVRAARQEGNGLVDRRLGMLYAAFVALGALFVAGLVLKAMTLLTPTVTP